MKNKLTEPFQVEEIYEFAALSLAAMPYRFVILDVDNFGTAFVIITIKFSYKLLIYYVMYTKWYVKIKNKIFSRKNNCQIEASPQDSENEKQEQELNKGFHDKQEENPNHYKSIVSETRMENRYSRSEHFDEKTSIDQKHSVEQSQKFFYQQFLDSSDILAALIIVLLLRTLDDNMVTDLEEDHFMLFVYESILELSLEFIFTFV